MNQEPLLWMVIVQLAVTAVTIGLFRKVLKIGNKESPDEGPEVEHKANSL
jgi:uncharacterized membrane protein YjgN (DUF898 family)